MHGWKDKYVYHFKRRGIWWSDILSSQKVVVLGDDQVNLKLLFLKVNWPNPSNEEVESVSPS